MLWLVIILSIILISIEFSGDFVLTYKPTWSVSKRLFIAVFLYFILGLCWCLMVLYRDQLDISLAMLNLLWQAGSAFSITCLSVLLLKEHVTTVGWISQFVVLIGFCIAVYDVSRRVSHD